ncbi:Serine/threonine-protein phosphatase 4 regulatory subunit 2 [Hondaea fermentalgiana]|uniref:Serine/threonine-protein phosphatase 4 regulatory subunit 2 n=1 Tax=Hondaea fermentalgiana TaxID=2315210 RepID=A0A2R5GI57_9STRA|nr:Serine/threonine-protein phosphatase 4 regulatory subunit 2 [Hondaea fermentalgiana]|eukprot:GBG30572.1 Serine/threonine-protein phosphatase 4 regulatory subunit 2 [Hondaea fermentalgiana]
MESELRNVASTGQVTDKLRGVLEDMRTTGVPKYEWALLKPLVHVATEQALDNFRKEHPNTDPVEQDQPAYDAQKQRLLSAIDLFEGAPFTLQRLCELILQPQMFYKNVSKLMFGLEKLLSVSSVLEVASTVNAGAGAFSTTPEPMEAEGQASSASMATEANHMSDAPADDGDAEMSDSTGPPPTTTDAVAPSPEPAVAPVAVTAETAAASGDAQAPSSL